MTEFITLHLWGGDAASAVLTNFDTDTRDIIIEELTNRVVLPILAHEMYKIVAEILNDRKINNVLFSVNTGIDMVMLDKRFFTGSI